MAISDPDVASAILRVGAMQVNLSNPYVYASHKIGPIYLDTRRLTTEPAAWNIVIQRLAERVSTTTVLEQVQAVSGGELGDLFFSIPVALILRKPHLAIRKARKGHGQRQQLIGAPETGTRVVHVADLITDGGSATTWVATLRAAGLNITDYYVVFDRRQGGAQRLAEFDVRLHALVQLDYAFLELAQRATERAESEVASLTSYLRDPDGWGRSFLLTHPEFIVHQLEIRDGRITHDEPLAVLTEGYPQLLPELRAGIIRRLRGQGVQVLPPGWNNP